MVTLEELERGWRNAAPSARDSGRVALIVLRRGGDVHERVERAEVSVEGGLIGDRWSSGEAPRRDAQITLINTTVGELIRNESHGPWDAGDNFHVSLDLSEDNLRAGARLRIGGALFEVTPRPHRGCAKFSARFGADALRWLNRDENRPLRLRGIYCEVIEPGVIAVGDTISVSSRPAERAEGD
jgi:MOSC domain-containing protein YiiM